MPKPFTRGDGHAGKFVLFLCGDRYEPSVCERIEEALRPWNPIVTNQVPGRMRPGDYVTALDQDLSWYEAMNGGNGINGTNTLNVRDQTRSRLQPFCFYVNRSRVTPQYLAWITWHEFAHFMLGPGHDDRVGNIKNPSLPGNRMIEHDQLVEGNNACGSFIHLQLFDFHGRRNPRPGT